MQNQMHLYAVKQLDYDQQLVNFRHIITALYVLINNKSLSFDFIWIWDLSIFA